MKLVVGLFAASLCASALCAQTTTAVPAASVSNPIISGEKAIFANAKNDVLRSAEKMPEENYAFRPTPEVRTFGQLIAHVADSQYEFCSPVLGKKGPDASVEKTVTSKAGLIVALKDAFAFCDAAYDNLTDADAGTQVKFFNREMAKSALLTFNTAHTFEHYGNIITYLRMKGLVPPSSEGRPAQAPQQPEAKQKENGK